MSLQQHVIKNVSFQCNVCDGCHNLLQKTSAINEVAICFEIIRYVFFEGRRRMGQGGGGGGGDNQKNKSM